MRITIPDGVAEHAASHAAALGYSNVEQFIVELIHSHEMPLDDELEKS